MNVYISLPKIGPKRNANADMTGIKASKKPKILYQPPANRIRCEDEEAVYVRLQLLRIARGV